MELDASDRNPKAVAAAYVRYAAAFDAWFPRSGWPADTDQFEHADGWARGYVYRLEASGRFDELLEILTEAVSMAPSIEVLGDIGAGPLETLMVKTGDKYVGKLRGLSASSSAWQYAIQSTYPTSMSESAAQLVQDMSAIDFDSLEKQVRVEIAGRNPS